MLEKAGNQVPGEDIANAAFYLIKEGGLDHSEIFGGTKTVQYTERVSREGLLSEIVESLFGPQIIQRTEEVKERGMNIKRFTASLDLFQEYQEKREQEQKKNRLKRNMNSSTIG